MFKKLLTIVLFSSILLLQGCDMEEQKEEVQIEETKTEETKTEEVNPENTEVTKRYRIQVAGGTFGAFVCTFENGIKFGLRVNAGEIVDFYTDNIRVNKNELYDDVELYFTEDSFIFLDAYLNDGARRQLSPGNPYYLEP